MATESVAVNTDSGLGWREIIDRAEAIAWTLAGSEEIGRHPKKVIITLAEMLTDANRELESKRIASARGA